MERAEPNMTLRQLAVEYTEAVKQLWRDALVSVVLFGSVARGEATPQSDIDLLLIATDLPPGRFARQDRLKAADDLLESKLAELRKQEILTEFCPILKTPQEATRLTPLYFDLVEDAAILYDPEGFFAAILERLRHSFARLGARRRSTDHVVLRRVRARRARDSGGTGRARTSRANSA